MERRQFTREFKLEAVRLIKERGVSYAQMRLSSSKAFRNEGIALTDHRRICSVEGVAVVERKKPPHGLPFPACLSKLRSGQLMHDGI